MVETNLGKDSATVEEIDDQSGHDDSQEEDLVSPAVSVVTETGRTRRGASRPTQAGGRRSRRVSRTSDVQQTVRTFVPKAELVCRNNLESNEWEVVLNVPEERGVAKVIHNTKLLLSDGHEYRLSSLRGNLVVTYEDGETDTLSLYDGQPLNFKFRSDWRGNGRYVRTATKGHFVLLVPRTWRRIGDPPVTPESCSDNGFLAHFFAAFGDENPSKPDGFKEYPLSFADSSFVLEGTKVYDDSQRGDLFVGPPPKVIAQPNVAWMRVGEERPSGWRGVNFEPTSQELGSVLGGRQGWLFARAYTEDIQLIDSFEFRYTSKLKQILVNGESHENGGLMTPEATGHKAAKLWFMGEDDNILLPTPSTIDSSVTIGPNNVVTVPQDPEADVTSWLIRSDFGIVEIGVRLPRVRWRIVGPDNQCGEWLDKPISFTREEFRDGSQQVIEVRFPASIRNIRAGFAGDQLLPYQLRIHTDGWNYLDLPMTDFVDHEEIDNEEAGDVDLVIDYNQNSIVLLRVLALRKSPISVEDHLNDVPEAPPLPSGLYQALNESIKPPSGNKGFSLNELRRVGLKSYRARALRIPVDRRRRSSHRINQEILEELQKYAKCS